LCSSSYFQKRICFATTAPPRRSHPVLRPPFSDFRGATPEAIVGFFSRTRPCATLGTALRGIVKGTVVIPLAGFSVSSVPLTCVVTIAHAIHKAANRLDGREMRREELSSREKTSPELGREYRRVVPILGEGERNRTSQAHA
jgi:hypothetical protein